MFLLLLLQAHAHSVDCTGHLSEDSSDNKAIMGCHTCVCHLQEKAREKARKKAAKREQQLAVAKEAADKEAAEKAVAARAAEAMAAAREAAREAAAKAAAVKAANAAKVSSPLLMALATHAAMTCFLSLPSSSSVVVMHRPCHEG